MHGFGGAKNRNQSATSLLDFDWEILSDKLIISTVLACFPIILSVRVANINKKCSMTAEKPH